MLLLSICGVLIVNMSADAATLATERARVREMLYETDSTNSVYSDALINEAINEGQNLLSNLLSYSANYENVYYTYGLSSTTGETSIACASVSVEFKKIISASILYPGGTVAGITPLIQVKPEEMPIRYYKGTLKDPTFFIGNSTSNVKNIFFYPANPGGTIGLYFTLLKPYTKLVTDSDTITVQDRYLNLLTLAAAMLVLTWDNQTTRAAALKQSLTDLLTIENNQMLNSNVIEKVTGGAK